MVNWELKCLGLGCEKILVVVMCLLEVMLICVGNEEYVWQNGLFGFSMLCDCYVEVCGVFMYFEFCGKSGKCYVIDLCDLCLVKIVCNVQELFGQVFFQYIDEDGCIQKIGLEDVNEYLRWIVGEEFFVKDFWIWVVIVFVVEVLYEFGWFEMMVQGKKNMLVVIEKVVVWLGNMLMICWKLYIYLVVFNGYFDGFIVMVLE